MISRLSSNPPPKLKYARIQSKGVTGRERVPDEGLVSEKPLSPGLRREGRREYEALGETTTPV